MKYFMYEKEIKLKLKELPEDLKGEVLDYIEFLLGKYKSVNTGQGSLSLTGKVDYQR